MLTLPEVLLHDFSADSFPKHVAELLAQFSRPLPQRLVSNEVKVALSPGVREIYEEALQTPSLSLEKGNVGIDSHPGRPVTDVVDTVLSCVRMVRTATTFSDGLQQARRSWISLLSLLGFAISEDIFILENLPFLLPQTKEKSTVHEGNEFEGKAALLLSAFIPRRIREQGDVAMDEPTSDDTVSSSSDASTGESYESYVTLDIPFDAHCLPGRGKRVDCNLPMIGVADEDQIQALMTSIVCQRHVLGISLPVVGISLSKYSTTASVVIGWNEVEGEQLKVHLAYPPPGGSSLGSYNIVDPTSALYFSQFILRLHPYLASIRGSLEKLEMQNFCWRLDHIGQNDEFQQSELSLHARIEAWLVDLPSVGPRHLPLDFRLLPQSMPNKNSNSRASSNKVGSNTLLRPPIQTSAASATKRSVSSSTKYYTTSAYAKLRPPSGLESMARGIETWLWDRETLRLVRLKMFQPVSELDHQVDQMVDLYNDLTQFCWPSSWKDISGIPQRDYVYEGIRTRLFQDYQKYTETETNTKAQNMPDDVYLSVTGHLSVLYKAVASALVCQRQAHRIGATESDERRAWDDLIKAMCCAPTEALSDSFFVERTIPLPRNHAVELGSDFPAVAQAELLQDLLFNQSYAVTRPQYSGDLNLAFRPVVMEAVGHAIANYASISSKRYSVKPRDRAHEPTTAIVDGICFLEYTTSAPGGGSSDNEPVTNKSSKPPYWLTSFVRLFSDVKERQTCITGGGKSFDAEFPGTGRVQKVEYDDSHARCFSCTNVTERLPTFPTSQALPVRDDSFRIYVPLIVAKYKRDPAVAYQSLHQVQMCCVSCLEYLDTIGITDFPVWGIATSGTVGIIIMAWRSTKSPLPGSQPEGRRRLNIMIDQTVRSFDLTQPLHALHFMTSIHRIYQQRNELEKKLSALSLTNCLDKPMPSYHDWTMPLRPKEPGRASQGDKDSADKTEDVKSP